jgi:Homeodomain-like domain
VLDEDIRTAILRLHAQGHGNRRIAHALGIARDSVRRIISCGSATAPPLVRAQLAEPWREQILELHARYEGHLGRVHDALTQSGAAISYPALTGFAGTTASAVPRRRRRGTICSGRARRCGTIPTLIKPGSQAPRSSGSFYMRGRGGSPATPEPKA